MQAPGENLKVVLVEFSALGWAVFVMSVIGRRKQECPHLELKTRPRGVYYNTFYGRDFHNGKPFQPSLLIVGKARNYLNEAPFTCSSLGWAPGLTHKH